MYTLKSNALECEFNTSEGCLYTAKINNLLSDSAFIPDGSGCEFEIKFADGTTVSSKNLPISEYAEKDGQLFFRFKEENHTTATMRFRVGKDGNTIEKQLVLTQSEPEVIDCIFLENIGIINSKSSYSVPGGETDIDAFYSNLGQPFYIDSLFFGCDFPITKNGIFHGRGQVIYYLGKAVEGEKLVCPTVVIGGAEGHLMADLRKAFFKYIESISLKTPYYLMYNTWYDRMLNIDVDCITEDFYKIEKQLTGHGIPPIDGYVLDDGWPNYKDDFWSINKKRFPNDFLDISSLSRRFGSEFGLWLGPRGGYNFTAKLAKRIEKGGNGYHNAESNDICVGSKRYLEKLESFFLTTMKENDISYWKLDGFCLKPCKNAKHDHITGGDHEMYFYTEMWSRWIKIFKKMRELRRKQGKNLWINFTCYVTPSPWWLQYVNSIWLQNSSDIGFAQNYPEGEQAQVDSEITYRDGIYYDFAVKRGLQFPFSNIYNHEPIYGREAHLDYTDAEFEKAFFWNACRGAALNELYISSSMMNEEKWQILTRVINWQKTNYHILRNAMFIGGNPVENNVYCYASWTEDGEGVIALRNPTHETAPLTLTLNKLMGCPESLNEVHRYNVLNKSGADTDETYNYNDKINLTLAPFEIKIFQFGKTDNRYSRQNEPNPFTISFDSTGEDGIVCKNDDIEISVQKGLVCVSMGGLVLKSENSISGSSHKITVVREKNGMIKIYVDNALDCSGYSPAMKPQLSCELSGNAASFKVIEKALPYDKLVEIEHLIKSRKRRN